MLRIYHKTIQLQVKYGFPSRKKINIFKGLVGSKFVFEWLDKSFCKTLFLGEYTTFVFEMQAYNHYHAQKKVKIITHICTLTRLINIMVIFIGRDLHNTIFFFLKKKMSNPEICAADLILCMLIFKNGRIRMESSKHKAVTI